MPNRGVIGQTQVGGRTVRYYKHWPSDKSFIADWDALSLAVPGATVFQSPHWQQAAGVNPDALGTLRLLAVYDGDRLTGVFPLERRWGGVWRSTGVTTTAYHDPLVHPDHAADTWDAALRAIGQIGGSVKSLTFELLNPAGGLETLVPPIAKSAGFSDVEISQASTDTTVELADTWDNYLAKLGGHDRKELRRKMKKAEEKGGAKLVVHDTPDAVAKALDETLELMESGGGAKARRTRWLYHRHFDIAGPALARTGRLIVYQLIIDNQVASALISLPQGGTQLLWNGAMNGAFYQWSPGIVLFGNVFRRAIEKGEKSIDLLRGNFPYKFSLGAVEKPMMRMTLRK